MMSPRCPGQDMRYWTPEDIFDVRCPYCGYEIEFWKDEPMRICGGCRREIRNPRIDLGCAKWCKHADECLGRRTNDEGTVAAPIVERLMALLEQRYADRPESLAQARSLCALADTILQAEPADPRTAKAAALLSGVVLQVESVYNDNPLPAGDLDLIESAAAVELLRRTGIEDDEVEAIDRILKSVFVTRKLETPESVIVWDIVQVARLPIARESGKGDRISSLLHTKAAQIMARK